MACWSLLPGDLLGLILELLTVPDHFRLAAVCVSWNLAVRDKIHRPKPQSPWLMLPGDSNSTASFFRLSEKRTYRIPLPRPSIHRRLCIGSSHGWLITADTSSEIHLLNPITAVQIQLPPITTLPFVDAVRDSDGCITEFRINDIQFGFMCHMRFTSERMLRYFFVKAVLSSPPSSNGKGDFIVMLIHNPFGRLAFARSGDKAWTPLRTRKAFPYTADIIHHRGQFYTVTRGGDLEAWDQDGSSFRPTIISKSIHFGEQFKYLVETLSGDLMLVLRYNDYVGDGSRISDLKTMDFKVLLLDTRDCEWFHVKNLHDIVLFVGNNHSLSLSAREFPELKCNCIYFTDDNQGHSGLRHYEGCDVEVFNLEAGSFQSFNSLGSHLNLPLSIWVTPILH